MIAIGAIRLQVFPRGLPRAKILRRKDMHVLINGVLTVLNETIGTHDLGNTDSIRREFVQLPVTDTGEPDYDFMEEFGRKMMSNKYNQYLAYLAISDTITA